MYEGAGPHAWSEGGLLAKSKIHRLVVDVRAVADGPSPPFSVSACLSPCLALSTVTSLASAHRLKHHIFILKHALLLLPDPAGHHRVASTRSNTEVCANAH